MSSCVILRSFPVKALIILALIQLCAGGCATVPVEPQPAPAIKDKPPETPPPAPKTDGKSISENYAVITAGPSDSYESLAQTYLGDRKLSYLISEFNKDNPIVVGKVVVIPLKPVNPGGLTAEGYQTVPVLCYHKFSPKASTNKIDISAETFDRQMAYLKNNGYNVITLKQFLDFIEYRQRPPKKSVLITIDDGWKSTKTIAYPILKKYGFSAVLFVYAELMKSKPNSITLSWDDLKEMAASGVIEIESHTVSHSDLTKIPDDKILRELKDSRRIIKEKTGIESYFLAYPYGNFNEKVAAAMKSLGYKAGFTVIKGSNAFFYNNLSLSRSMVYRSEKIEDFVKLLETSQLD